ncbi:MAG: multicopper oxidase domain-containing protein [Deltaproteobacteria bacterium]
MVRGLLFNGLSGFFIEKMTTLLWRRQRSLLRGGLIRLCLLLAVLFVCIARPTNAEMREFTLSVTEGEIDLKGVRVPVWMYNGVFPGPEIRVKQGDTVRVKLKNLSGAKHGMFFHGVKVDSRTALQEQEPVDPDFEYVYEFKAEPVGTHLYHCSYNMAEHLSKGMFGAFIVEGKDEKKYDKEFVYIISDWSSRAASGKTSHESGHPASMKDNDITTINNKVIAGDEPLLMEVRNGETVRVRIANLGLLPHKLRFPQGLVATVTHEDGYLISNPRIHDALTIYPGKSHDLAIVAVKGKWPLYHSIDMPRPAFGAEGATNVSHDGHKDGHKHDTKTKEIKTKQVVEDVAIVLEVKG